LQFQFRGWLMAWLIFLKPELASQRDAKDSQQKVLPWSHQ
jgi:hypothetical protein